MSEDDLKCEICGEDATLQPPGGINAWLHYAHAHEDDLDAPHRLMLELVDAILQYDDGKLFWSNELDEMNKQLDREGWRVLCEDCAIRVPQ